MDARESPRLLILDLDETLIYSTPSRLGRDPDFSAPPYFVYRRPFLEEFIAEARRLFTLAVWTSSAEDYAAEIVAELFEPASLAFTWARDRCTRRYDGETGEYYWVKDLKKVKRRGFDLRRVLIVDDTREKVSRNYGNYIRVNPFEGDPQDRELLALSRYLPSLSELENVRAVEKRNWRVGTGET